MPIHTGPMQVLRSAYLRAQLDGNRREALRLVLEDGLAQGHSVSDLQAGVVQAAQREIGALWQQNRISIAQEHMATAISHVVMSRLFDEAEAGPRLDRRVVVACVEGELHEFPARLVADYLDLGGFDVRYLGANVPTDDLLTLLREETPDLLALSVTMSFNVAALRATLTRVKIALPELPVLIGGHALEWEPRLAQQAGVATCASDATCLIDTARRMLRLPLAA
jgi:MerR family transcriptional regulator, light-induced transcriptional regulator